MKKMLILSLLLAALALSGCAFAMREYDDTNEKRINELTAANRELEAKVMNFERRIPMLNNQIEGLREENKKLKEEMAAMETKVAAYESAGVVPIPAETVKEPSVPLAKPQAEGAPKPTPPAPQLPAKEAPKAPAQTAPETQAKAELTPAGAKLLELARAKKSGEAVQTPEAAGPAANQRSGSEAQATGTKPAEETASKVKTETPAGEPAKVAPSTVKLKVLSGTGNLLSGQQMAKTLTDKGYKAESVDLAPRPFEQNTVYYAKGREAAAEEIRKIIGGDAVAKPLSWDSEFEIIVVTGGR